MSDASVIKMVQELLANEEKSKISAALITEKVDLVVGLNATWKATVSKEAVIAELIRRSSQWIGDSSILKNEVGHTKWLTTGRKSAWRYWQRYREFLERKNSIESVDALDRVTDDILGLLEDPAKEGGWDRRGLVVGNVQSGKTSNYTGLICKAADAGYKIIIVLAGIHNNLRSQTQMRLDEGFLGYETHPDPENLNIIGVGKIDSDPLIRPNYATNRSNLGDFNTAIANKLGISPEQRPWLFVVKKNKTVLEKLNKWIRNHVADAEDLSTGRKTVTRLPVLLIDDEADNASVDTGEDSVGEDGNPNLEYSPKVINGLIRRLLHTFSKSAYVGYTATPFANIFIHERAETSKEGPDLFPSSFIINLGSPSTYIGPAKIFGRGTATGREAPLPVFREIDDAGTQTDMWMPPKHKSGHVPLYDGKSDIPESLKTAVDSFVLACAAREYRGQGADHCSMLIHTTRFNKVQGHVFDQVAEYLRLIRQRIQRRLDDADVMARLESLWNTDFVPTSQAVRKTHDDLEVPAEVDWSAISELLPNIVGDIEVRKINGTAKDALDYADAGRGLKVIAIGGDKLSRGLTLEGLCVSYFLRASKMYDTLMQMGRWFGYRPGYADLCRLYSTHELYEWFGHIADASEELREEFDLMAASGSTPRDFGLKVQSHSTMLVTSKLKMRSARNLSLSFSGQVVETVSLHCAKDILNHNLSATRTLIRAMGEPQQYPEIRMQRPNGAAKWNGALWENVSSEHIVDFLSLYKTHPNAHKVNSQLIVQFIEGLNRANELSTWTVALLGGNGSEFVEMPDIKMVERATNDDVQTERYSIGRLLSPRDETLSLDAGGWEAALALTKDTWRSDPAKQKSQTSEPSEPSGRAARAIAGKGHAGMAPRRDKGLLLLYPLDPAMSRHPVVSANGVPVIAFGLSFPDSDSGVKVNYKVNNVLWETEYGASE